MLPGLRFLHSASTSLSRIARRIQPCHQPVLVWTRQSDFQDADPHRRWFTEGVPVRAYRDTVGLLSGTGETVVAQHCSDWNQDLVLAISRACGVRCSPLSHSGQRPKDACFKLGGCDRQGAPGLGSPLFYINTWAMVWPNDYPAVAPWKVGVNKTDTVWTCLSWPAWVLPSMQIQLYSLEKALIQVIL